MSGGGGNLNLVNTRNGVTRREIKGVDILEVRRSNIVEGIGGRRHHHFLRSGLRCVAEIDDRTS